MYKFFGMSASGNCYKVKLLLEQLGIPYQWVEVDTLNGATHTPEFLAINPNAQVPVLEVGSGRNRMRFFVISPMARRFGLWKNLNV